MFSQTDIPPNCSPASQFHGHWVLLALTAGATLRPRVGVTLSTCFSVPGVNKRLPQDTDKEVVTEPICELSIHIHPEGGHLFLLIEFIAWRKTDTWGLSSFTHGVGELNKIGRFKKPPRCRVLHL